MSLDGIRTECGKWISEPHPNSYRCMNYPFTTFLMIFIPMAIESDTFGQIVTTPYLVYEKLMSDVWYVI